MANQKLTDMCENARAQAYKTNPTREVISWGISVKINTKQGML